MGVRRLFVEKKRGFDVEAQGLRRELTRNLGIAGLEQVRVLQRYDTEGIPAGDYEKAKTLVFSEPPMDEIYDDTFPLAEDERVIAVSFLPGQYDQRADSAAQCIQLISFGERPEVSVARVLVFKGAVSDADFDRIRQYVINPVESHEVSMDRPQTLHAEYPVPEDVRILHGFLEWDEAGLSHFMTEMGFAMSLADLQFCQAYFRDTEQRDPTITELRMIDTYWSDHCRHTTFLTDIDEVSFSDGPVGARIRETWAQYLATREIVHAGKHKELCLMDLATIGMKALRKNGRLDNLDVSEEINACSIVVQADVAGRTEEWLVMFKNETHNHPTEIEPFGGAATCLGGAIRDPLSGRSYVYQAMRVTGSGDPTVPLAQTLPGKLPQRVITTTAAHGYSSYGNQIGLATGQVTEIYHPGYVAKRMEIGAVVGAAPRSNVVRQIPAQDDIVVLLGGRTGRDGCGGATGSSKEHTEESLATCGAEVQKGNPPTERKIQRLFRDPEVTRLIKRCNDFGAGGVSVAIGELADGLDINLDAVPKKYEGLDGTELAISESQERMAVVVAPEHAAAFIAAARKENLEAVKVAVVTSENRLRMRWRGKAIVDVSRDFLNTNGVRQHATARIAEPDPALSPLDTLPASAAFEHKDLGDAWKANLGRLNVCSQKGLSERFDSTIGSASVLMPFGGVRQMTPAEGMVAKLPVPGGDTVTGTAMTFGFHPEISSWSPYHGAVYAVLESLAKLTVCGASPAQARLTFQEYFEKLGQDPVRWGKPLSALLGAFWAQMAFGAAAIGGKDSMSGTFRDMHVPPTLVSFALAPMDVRRATSAEFKKPGSRVVLVSPERDECDLPNITAYADALAKIHTAITHGVVRAAATVQTGGIAAAVSRMAFGNNIGMTFSRNLSRTRLFCLDPGAILLELPEERPVADLLPGVPCMELGMTVPEPVLTHGEIRLPLDVLEAAWTAKLDPVFPTATAGEAAAIPVIRHDKRATRTRATPTIARPRVFIPVFPGTNCEYDSVGAFAKAGAVTDVFVFNNLSARDIDASVHEMEKRIRNSQIIMLPGGFSAGDEPEGSGKFIATVFRNMLLQDAVSDLLQNRDGLMMGICNGFQALVKLGLLPGGSIAPLTAQSPTLSFNRIGRHVSSLVRTKNVSVKSPWMLKEELDDIRWVPVSHGEGRFVADPETLERLAANGQIVTQYVDLNGNPTMDMPGNPNGSVWAIEGIVSEDGRILGKMGHSERYTDGTYVNVPGQRHSRLFEGGVAWFK
jgi:phosphoribosylformylglycinamidine synthase